MEENDQRENLSQNPSIRTIQHWNEGAYNLHYLNPGLGATYAKKAYEFSLGKSSSENTSWQGYADSLFNLSHFNMLLGNLQIAVEQAEESLQTYQKLNQEQPQAELYAHLGQLYDILNQRNLAIDYLVKGLEITNKHQFELTEGKISLHIGSVYLGMGNYHQCIHTSLQAEGVFKKYKQPTFQAYAMMNLAQAYSHTQKMKEAFQAIQLAVEIATKIGSPVIEAETLYYRGMIHCQNAEIELAKTDLLNSQQLNKKMHMKYLNLRVKLGLSELFIISQDFQQASLLLERCLKSARTIGIEQLILESHKKLSDVYEKMEKYALSLSHFKQYSELTDHLFTQQSLQKVQTIEVLYRTRSATREVEVTREKNLTLEHEILERKNLEVELRKSEKRYRTMASFDPLTHLYNRRHFYNLAEIEFERAIRYNHPLTLFMIDLDHFKQINDRFGHLVGDDLLEFVATICKRNLRKIDIIGRYGGEEFIVLLPETGAEQALLLANRICDTIRDTRMPSSKGSIAVTASIGISVLSNGNGSLEILMDQADQAMYTAKNNGRNQVYLAPNL
jgi:diguanylate cyclase (GGDEF)-like protein